MRKFLAVLILTIFPVLSNAAIDGKTLNDLAEHYKEYSANHLINTTSAGTFIGYVTGIASVLNWQGKICISDGTTNGKVVNDVYNFIHENPQMKGMNEGSLVVMLALTDSYKCKSSDL